MIAPRKRWKLITLGRVMVLSVALNLQLLQQSLAQPRNGSVCMMRTCQEAEKTEGFVEVDNHAVPDRDKDKEDDLDGSQERMEVRFEPSATLAKKPWAAKKQRCAAERVDVTHLPDAKKDRDGFPLENTPSPGRKKQPIEHEDNMCYNKVDGDGYFVDEIDGKVIFRLNTDLMRQDTFVKNVDYTVGKKLGKGGNGQVYEVSILSDRSKKVVVKRTTYRIKKEDVEVYKLLGDHNHIVKHLGGTFSKNGHACIFMEQCDDSLYNYMKNTLKRRLSVAEAMFYWLQIREAVEYLHDRGIIHKDIKSENVLIMMKGRRVLLCDFDSAKILRNDLTEEGLEPLGTEGFISPEVLAHESHGRPADIFNMGCWLIEMTIGSPDNNSLRGKIEKLREQDCELAELVEACVSERPEDRPTARSLLDWPVVKRYIAAGEGEVGRSQDQETSAPEDQTRALHALEYRAGESGLNEEL